MRHGPVVPHGSAMPVVDFSGYITGITQGHLSRHVQGRRDVAGIPCSVILWRVVVAHPPTGSSALAHLVTRIGKAPAADFRLVLANIGELCPTTLPSLRCEHRVMESSSRISSSCYFPIQTGNESSVETGASLMPRPYQAKASSARNRQSGASRPNAGRYLQSQLFV